MAYIHRDGYWVLKVEIDGKPYLEATDIRGSSETVKAKVKRLQNEFKLRKKQELAEAEKNVRRNEHGDIVDQSINAAFLAYYDQQGQHAKGHGKRDILRDLKWIVKKLGPETLVSEITTAKLVTLREKRRVMPKKWRTKDGKPPIDKKTGQPKPDKPISGRTCNATFERLKFCLNWLRDNGYTVPEIAWKRVWVEETPRETEFTVDTAKKVFTTFRKDYLDCLEFGLLGGPRRRQFVELKWSDIDWDRRVLKLLRQKKRGAKKSPKPHIIPITSRMMELILKQIDPESGQPHHPVYVWTYVAQRTYINRKANGGYYEEGERYPITYQGLGTAWRRWKEENGIENSRIHDMRHAAGTLVEDTAGDLGLVQRMLDHNNRATTERYIHGNVNRLRAAMEATHNALVLRADDESRTQSRTQGAATSESVKSSAA